MRSISNVMEWSARCREHFFPWRAKAERAEHADDIAEAGITEAYTGYRLERRSPRFHLLVYPLDGEGYVYLPNREWTVIRDQLLIVPAGTPFGYFPQSDHWRFIWIHLPAEERWRHLHQRGVVVRDTVMTGPLERLTVDFLRESRGRGPSAVRASALYAELIELYVNRELGVSDIEVDTDLHNLLNHTWDKVSKDLKRPWTVENLAFEMGLSASHFYRVVRENLHTSPMKMVTRLRMERAQELLIMHDVPIAVIADQVGYSNPFAFAMAFKKFSGVTPGQFRNRR
jgi:AraC family transcriptional activator of mtrCDE